MSSLPTLDFTADARRVAWLLGRAPLRARAAWCGAIFLVLLAAAAALAWQHLTAARAYERLQSRVQAQDQERALKRPARALPASPAELLRERAWAEVADRLNVDWLALLDALEASTPVDVTVLEIEPRPAQQSVDLTVQAVDVDAVLRYIDALNGTPGLRSARLLRHEADVAAAAPGTLRFVIAVFTARPAEPSAPQPVRKGST